MTIAEFSDYSTTSVYKSENWGKSDTIVHSATTSMVF